MAVRALLVGLCESESDALSSALGRMHVQSETVFSADLAKTAIQDGGFQIVMVGYEGEGCGLPLAVGLGGSVQAGLSVDCILVADQLCPALSKAAKDLGILAVLTRPVRTKDLAFVIESFVSKRLGRRDGGALSKVIA
jgi:hypothetical protein